MSTDNKTKIGLVLGSGAARGLAHIGVLKVLHDHQIPIDIITGTSIGAFIGAAYAAGMHPDHMIEQALSMNWIRILNLIDPIIHKSGFIKGKKIENFFKKLVGDLSFDELNIPFACQCTDVNTGEVITIKMGSVSQAIRASLSIPGVMVPLNYEGRQLVDGGLIEPVPVKEAQIMGATKVIAVNVTTDVHQYTYHQSKKKKILARIFNQQVRIPSTYQVLLQSIYIMESEIAKHTLSVNSPDILIKPQVDQFRLFEFYKTKQIIEAGIQETKNHLEKIKLLCSK